MRTVVTCFLLMVCLRAQATTYASSQYLTIIIDPPPPCTLAVDDVDFGMVAVSQIDNSSYKKMPLRFAFSCAEVNTELSVSMKIIAAALDEHTAQTSAQGLGVQFFSGNEVTPLALNSTISGLGQTADVVARGLSVMPFLVAGSTVPTGDFRAQMTLQMEYQ